MKRLLITALLLPTAALAAENQATFCTHGDSQRTIEVAYPAGEALPCEVRYSKDGETSVLWSASNEAGFCESKAEAFVAKQVDWGWQCESDKAGPEPGAAVAGTEDGEATADEAESESAGEDPEAVVAELETEDEDE